MLQWEERHGARLRFFVIAWIESTIAGALLLLVAWLVLRHVGKRADWNQNRIAARRSRRRRSRLTSLFGLHIHTAPNTLQ